MKKMILVVLAMVFLSGCGLPRYEYSIEWQQANSEEPYGWCQIGPIGGSGTGGGANGGAGADGGTR